MPIEFGFPLGQCDQFSDKRDEMAIVLSISQSVQEESRYLTNCCDRMFPKLREKKKKSFYECLSLCHRQKPVKTGHSLF